MAKKSPSAKRRPTKKRIREIVQHYLKAVTPSGYSLVVPDNGVMYVSDGIDQEHERWYIVVKPEPEYIADTRKNEYLEILSDVENKVNNKLRLTIYLTSMLPVL